MTRSLQTLVACVSMLSASVHSTKLELGPPSYGNPVFVRRQDNEPARIFGYRWVRTDCSCYLWNRGIGPDPAWALHRTNASPPNDRAALKSLGVDLREVYPFNP